jgi:hypothetical protein
MSGDGMSMCPPPFLWLTTTDQCWPGVLKLHSSEVSWFWGCGILKLLKKYFFKETFAILASMRGFGFKNINFGIFSQVQESPKPFFDCGGRIISAYSGFYYHRRWPLETQTPGY